MEGFYLWADHIIVVVVVVVVMGPKEAYLLSVACDFFFFWGGEGVFVDTITLERLNQSEPNFHS